MSLQARKRKSATYGEQFQTSQKASKGLSNVSEFSGGVAQRRDALSDNAIESTKRPPEVLNGTQTDVERHLLEAFLELREHYKNPDNIHDAFSQDTLDSICVPLRKGPTSQHRAEVQLLALLVLKQVATQGLFIGEQGIECIEPFLLDIDTRLRNEVIRILGITADWNEVWARFILLRPECVRGITHCMTDANNTEELESALISLAVLCRESSKSRIPLPHDVLVEIRRFFESLHDVRDIISKRLLIILLEVLVGLLGGPPEQIGIVIEGGTVGILLRLVHDYHPKHPRREDHRAITIWSFKCLQRIALYPPICMATFRDILPDLAELLRCVLVAAPANAKVEGCDFITNVVVSCPSFLPVLISGRGRLLKFLIHTADIEVVQDEEVLDASLRALSKMINQGSGDMVAQIVNQGIFSVFTEFLCRDNRNNALLLICVLHAIERVCNLGLHERFYGWDEIDDLAKFFNHSEVSSMATRIYSSFCPSDQRDPLFDSENDTAVRNLFSELEITPSSKRRKVCNDVPVLGMSNRR